MVNLINVSQFDEYVSGALSCVKYSDFLAKGANSGVLVADGSGKYAVRSVLRSLTTLCARQPKRCSRFQHAVDLGI